jgi:hypothetical protein
MLARPMTAHRGARVVSAAAALLPLAGCAYLSDRGRDLTDIVDVKGGVGGIGLGVKARATEFIGTGVGIGATYDTTEKFGRYAADSRSAFVGLGFAAIDGQSGVCPGPGFEFSLLGLRIQDDTVIFPWAWFRFGGEVVLPGVRGGLFVNLGELVDFLAGIAGLDPVGDDGLPLGTPLGDYLTPKHRAKEAPEPPGEEQAPDAK